MKRFLPLCALAPGLLLLAGAQAKAQPIPAPAPQWTYSFSPGQATVNADKGGGVSFTGEPLQTAAGNSNVVLTSLRVFSSTTSGNENLSSSAGAYSIAMTLGQGSDSHTFTFTGNLSGTLNSQSAIINNTFTGDTTQSATINGHKFTVTLTTYTAPNPPSSDPNTQTLPGSIGAYVTVDDGVVVKTDTAPEPSTLLLSCLGLSFLGAARWRKGCQVSVTLG